VDRPLAQLGAKRRVALSLPFFVPAVFAIAQTDLVLTMPRKLAKITAAMAGVRMVEPPREIKAFPYFMISGHGIRDSLANLRMHGFANNCVRLPGQFKPSHSSRSSIKGSTDSARCAGIHVASSPSNNIARTTPANTSGSRGVA
jgi:hypothetical protein